MKNNTFLINTCIAALVCLPLAAFSADTKKSSPAASASPAAKTSAAPAASAAKQPRPVSFHGTISAVDQTAKTFTIAGKETSRVFKVTEKTVVTKAGQPATMADITANTEVSGSYWKHDDDSLEAKTVKIGGATAEKKTAGESKKSKAAASPAASPKASPKSY
jgi:hypothetical protein